MNNLERFRKAINWQPVDRIQTYDFTDSRPLLEQLGGYDCDIITTFYGPAGSGKTNFCVLAAASIARRKKVIFIDTEGGFSFERLNQLASGNGVSGKRNARDRCASIKAISKAFDRTGDGNG
jgi:RecA/RadA recombinase